MSSPSFLEMKKKKKSFYSEIHPGKLEKNSKMFVVVFTIP